jgi:hypothetical protein
LMVRRSRVVLLRQKPVIVRNITLPGKLYPLADIHFSFVEREERVSDVLIMFEPASESKSQNTKREAARAKLILQGERIQKQKKKAEA